MRQVDKPQNNDSEKKSQEHYGFAIDGEDAEKGQTYTLYKPGMP